MSTYTVDYALRKPSAIPSGLSSTVSTKAWLTLIRYAVSQMKEIRYYASRFMNLHLTRLLENKLPLGDLSKIGLRSTFLCIAEGSKGKLNPAVQDSRKLWQQLTKAKPSIRGLNTIATKTFETYYIAFKNYHTFGLFQHYKRHLVIKHKVSMKNAQVIAIALFTELKIDIMPSILKDEEFNYVNNKLKSVIEQEKQDMKAWFMLPSMTLEAKVKLHFEIAKSNEKQEASRLFSIAPLCSSTSPFIELCSKSIEDLYRFSLSKKHCHLQITSSEILDLAKASNTLLGIFKPEKIAKKLKQGQTMLTVMTDGITLYCLWCKEIHCQKTMNETAYQKHLQNKSRYQKEKQIKMDEQLETKKKVDKRTSRKRPPKMMKAEQYKKINKQGLLGLNPIAAGLFSKTALKRQKGQCIAPDVPIVSIDPGHRHVVACATTTLQEANPTHSYDLSLGHYYDKIGNRSYNDRIRMIKKKNGIQEVELKLAETSLKTSNLDVLSTHLKENLKFAPELFKFYGSNNHARERFKIIQKKQRFFNKIACEIAPDPRTIVALGNAKFASSCKGLSSCPIAKVVDALARERQVVITPETNTTRKCSYCCTRNAITKQTLSKRISISVSGKEYNNPIHGLRHCMKCSQNLNRDKNAARGIFYSFKHHYKHGCLPAYLTRRKRKVYSSQSHQSNKPISTLKHKRRRVNHEFKAVIESNS